MYVEITSLSNVQTFISIKADISDQDDVICNVGNGDVILVRHPNKLFMSYYGLSSSAKFFINTWYSTYILAIQN